MEMNTPTPLQSFAAAAQTSTDIWRLIIALLVVFGGLLLFGLGIGAVGLLAGASEGAADVLSGFETRTSALVILATFLVWQPAIWVAIRLLYRRSYATLFGPSGSVNWSQFFRGLGIAAGFAILSTVLAWAYVGAPEWTGVAALPWLAFACLAAPLIYIQSSAEELLFRGLLLQHMAARFGALWAWGLVPSALFGLLHWNPDGYGAAVWMVLLITGITGLIFALVTAATGNLGMAMGLHFGLNLYGLLGIAPNEAFDALALAHWPDDGEALMRLLAIDLLTLMIACVVAVTFYRRSLRQG